MIFSNNNNFCVAPVRATAGPRALNSASSVAFATLYRSHRGLPNASKSVAPAALLRGHRDRQESTRNRQESPRNRQESPGIAQKSLGIARNLHLRDPLTHSLPRSPSLSPLSLSLSTPLHPFHLPQLPSLSPSLHPSPPTGLGGMREAFTARGGE